MSCFRAAAQIIGDGGGKFTDAYAFGEGERLNTGEQVIERCKRFCVEVGNVTFVFFNRVPGDRAGKGLRELRCQSCFSVTWRRTDRVSLCWRTLSSRCNRRRRFTTAGN